MGGWREERKGRNDIMLKIKTFNLNQNFAKILIGIVQNLEIWERKINLFIFFQFCIGSFLKLFFFNKFDYVLY